MRDAVPIAPMILVLAWTSGHVTPPPAGTDLLVRAAAGVGLRSTEDVTDFHMAATLGPSPAFSAATARWEGRR